MQLESIHVERFGCLHDFTTTFAPGLNVIRGPNESGKSTLHQALLMALMALPNQNKTTAEWCSWGSQQWYLLQLTFTDAEGNQYQLTKDFDHGSQELVLPNVGTTRSREHIEETVETVLGTRSLLMFQSTVCVRQDSLDRIADGRTEIAQSLETIVTGSEDDVYTAQALKRLDNAIRDFRKGFSRTAAQPGPLGRTRDEQIRLERLVTNYAATVQSQEADEQALEEAKNRLAEIGEELTPLTATWEQANRLREVQADFKKWAEAEQALESKLSQVRSAQREIDDAKAGLQTLGNITQLTESDVRKANDLASRIKALQEERANYETALEEYERELADHRRRQADYELAQAAYETQMATHEEAQANYQEAMEAYQAAVGQYEQDLAAYQEAWRPYEQALANQRGESEEYQSQLETYRQEYAAYEVELAEYERAKGEQDELLAEYEQAYEAYEQKLTEYENHRAEVEQSDAGGDVPGQRQPAAQPAQKRKPSGPTETTQVSAIRLVLIVFGMMIAITGVLVLALARSFLPAVALLVVGIAVFLASAWPMLRGNGNVSQKDRSKSEPARAKLAPEQLQATILERPKAPERPKLLLLTAPRSPVLPQPPVSTSEKLLAPDVQRPSPRDISKPVAPTEKAPLPPQPPPPPPTRPNFDEQRLAAAVAELQERLETMDCSTLAELNSRFAEAEAFRGRQNTARSRLEGLLGDSTVEALEQRRREASRQRRDAQEILEEPQLQQASRLTPITYNHLGTRITQLGTEKTELLEKRQRLQIKLEQQPISREQLLQAEEALESARLANARAQERIDVYELTHELLGLARTRTLKRAQERLGPQTAGYLGRLTRGRYQDAWIDSELNIELQDPAAPGQRVKPQYLSRGAQDQLYMAARLALVDLLFPQTRPPILLDDPFVHFDPERLAAAVDMCCDLAEERQILLFTCSDNYNHVGHHILMPGVQPVES